MGGVTAKDALRHPCVLQFHNPEEELEFDHAIRIPIDDNTKLTVADYRDRLYDEVLRKKKEQHRSLRRTLETQQEVPRQQPQASTADSNASVTVQPSSAIQQ